MEAASKKSDGCIIKLADLIQLGLYKQRLKQLGICPDDVMLHDKRINFFLTFPSCKLITKGGMFCWALRKLLAPSLTKQAIMVKQFIWPSLLA